MSEITQRYYGDKAVPSAEEVDPIDIFVGERLQEYRKALNLPRGTLGSEIGVSGTQIWKYETARNRVSAGRLARLAHFLQKSISQFFPPSSATLMTEAPPCESFSKVRTTNCIHITQDGKVCKKYGEKL